MEWLVFAILLLAGYLLYGLLVASPYKRRFAADFPADETEDGYLKPLEVVDEDEPDISRRVSEAFSADSRRLARDAGRNDPDFYEPHWGHTSGLLPGTLEINDIERLPEQFRVGLFKENRSYPVVARVGVTRDTNLKFAVNRVAVKLQYPDLVPNVYAENGKAKELDLLFAEGEMPKNGSGRAFFARDARQLDMAVTMNPPSMKTLKTIANWRNLAILAGIMRKVAAQMKPLRASPANASGWAGKPYFSAGPFALGEGAMKFCLIPKQAHEMPAIDVLKTDPAPPHKQAMNAWLAEGKDARFDLRVQLATPESIASPGPGDPPKSVMAAEYCDLVWQEDHAPFVTLGTLTLRADDSLNRRFRWSPLQFNAWNTLHDMRPLGQLFRVRKHAHKAHSNTRVEHLYGETPGAMTGKCPFAG